MDGVRRNEKYLLDQQIEGTFPATRVPAGSYFMMGDNRNDSADSRVFGPVPNSAILGEAFAIYWPISRIQGV